MTRIVILSVFALLFLSGCEKWKPGWESKDDDSSSSIVGAEGYYRDYGKGLSFLILRDGTLWGWNERGSEAFYGDLDLSDDDEPAFEGDLVSFTDRDYYAVEGVIDAYYSEQSDISGIIRGDRNQVFDAVYDGLYEDRASLMQLSGDYRNKSSFISIGEQGEFDGVWEDCRFDGKANGSRQGNYFEFSLTSPDYECLYAVGDEITGIMLNDAGSLILVGMDDLNVNGILLVFEVD